MADGLAQPRLFHGKSVEPPVPLPVTVSRRRLRLPWRVLNSRPPGSIARKLRFDRFVVRSYKPPLRLRDAAHVERLLSAHPDDGNSPKTVPTEFEKAIRGIAARRLPIKTCIRIKRRRRDQLDKLRQPTEALLHDAIDLVSLCGKPHALGYGTAWTRL